MASQLLGIKTRFTNDLGSPLVGGQVYTYFAGTSTNQDSYSDAALTVPNTNPVILDDTGSADIFLKGAYRIRVFDKSGRFIEEQDNVTQAASQGDTTELSNKVNAVEVDLSKVKLDTGITVTAKNGGVDRTLASKNSDIINVKDFGAKCDGITDDTDAIQLCVDSVGENSIIKFPDAAKVVITRSISILNDGVELDLGTCEIDVTSFSKSWVIETDSIWNSGRNRAVFEFRGAYVGKYDINSAAAKHTGSIDLGVNAANVTAGDLVHLVSPTHWYTSSAIALTQQEVNYVTSVAGTTVTLAHPLSNTYPLTTTVEIVTPNKQPKLTGGIFEGLGVYEPLLNGFGLCAIHLEGTFGGYVKPKRIKGFQNKAIAYNWAYGLEIGSTIIQGLEWDYSTPITEDVNSGFYGVFGRTARFCKVSGVVGLRTRHLLDGYANFDFTADTCWAIKSHKASFTTHEASSDWTLTDCKDFNATNASMLWRGFNVKLIDCNFQANMQDSSQYCFYDGGGASIDDARTYTFESTKLKASRNGIYLHSNNYADVNIINSYVSGGKSSGYPAILIDAFSIKNFSSIDTSIDTNNNSHAIRFTKMSDGDSVRVSGGKITGFRDAVVHFTNTAPLNIVTRVNNATLEPISDTYGIITSVSNLTGISDAHGNIKDNAYVGTGLQLGNANNSDSKVLDWYQEGSNPADLELLVNGASSNAVVAAKHIRWTRIGNVVSFNAYIALTSKPTNSGGLSVKTGIPFKAYAGHTLSLSLSTINSTVRNAPLSARISSSSTILGLDVAVSGSSTETRNIQVSDILDSTIFNITGNYLV